MVMVSVSRRRTFEIEGGTWLTWSAVTNIGCRLTAGTSHLISRELVVDVWIWRWEAMIGAKDRRSLR